MPTSIDSLQIEINAKAQSANDAIDRLVGKLDRLSTSLGKMNTINLNGLANGVDKLGRAMQTMNAVKTADFTRLATNLAKLGTINVSALNSTASSLSHLTRAFNTLGAVSTNAQQVGTLAQNLSRLGSASMQRAITNIPQLAVALNNLMTTLSRSPRVSQNVIQMTNALANLSAQGAKVGSASNSISKELNRASSSATRARASFGGLASAIGKFYATYFLLIRAFKGLGNAIGSTADYVEAFNYFTVSMGKIASKWDKDWENYGDENARNYSNKFFTTLNKTFSKLSGVSYDPQTGLLSETGLQNLGLNLQEVTQYAAQLSSMMDAVGQSGEVTLATTNAFVKLAGDISSLYNIDYQDAANKIRSVLQGQSRAGYGFGWDTTMAALQATADRLDLSKPVSEMAQWEKQQLRILTILEQSRVAWGDQSNTINTLANQMRIFKNNISEVGMTLGQLFVPILQKVMPIINGVTIAIKRLLSSLATLLGIKIEDTGQGFTDMGDDIDGIGDAFDDATASAKKFKTYTLGIDELNIQPEQTDSSGSGGGIGGGIDLTDEILEATSEYERVWQEAFDKMENRAQEFADRIEEFFAPITEPLKDLFKDISIGDWFSAGQDTSKIVVAIFDLFSRAIDDVDWYKIGENIGDYFRGIDWNEVLGSIGNIMWQALKASWELYMGAFSVAPLETALISLASMPNLLKSITASKFITGFKKLATNAKLLTTALAGNKKSTTVLLQQYPKLGKAVDVARKAFSNFRFGIENGNFLTGLNNGISTIRNNLTGLQKGAITAIAGLAEFTIISNTFEDLVYGSENLVSSIVKIGGTVSIAGAAMYTALGPAGLAIAGVTALVSAVNGINNAFDKIRAEEIGNEIKNAMSNPGGMPLSEITSNFANAFSEASESFNFISEKSNEMDAVQRNIEDTWTEIYKIQEAMENGVLSVEEGKAQLETLFSELATLTEQKFSTMNTAILSAYGENGSFRTALDSIGADTESAIDAMIEYGYQGSARAKEISEELVGLDINSEEYKKLVAELATLTGEMSSFEKATSDFTYNMNALQGQIDYSEIFLEDGSVNIELLKEYLSQATESLAEYENSLDEAGKEISQYWQEIYNSPFATEEQKEIAKIQLEYIPQAIEEMKSEARLQVISFTDMLQNDFISKTDEIIDDSISDWNSKNSVEKWWSGIFGAGRQGEYVKEAIDQQKKNISEVSAVIDEELEKLGIEGAGWGAEAAEKIYSSLFQSEYHHSDMGSGGYYYTLNEEYKNIIDEATADLPGYAEEKGEFIGENTVNGITNGILDNVQHSDNAAEDMALSVIDVTRGSLGINSPSKVFYEIGEYVVQGLINGIESKFLELENSVLKMSNMVKQGVKSALDIHSPSRVMFELGEYTMKGFKNGMENIYEPISNSLQRFNYEISVFPPSLNALNYGNSNYANKSAYQNNANIEMQGSIKNAFKEAVVEMLAPYLADIAQNTRETADKDLLVAIGDRDIYKASLRGAKSSGVSVII